MTWGHKLEVGLKEDAPFRKDDPPVNGLVDVGIDTPHEVKGQTNCQVMTMTATATAPSPQAGITTLLVAKAFGVSDTGKVRPVNEDQFLIAEFSKAMRVQQTTLSEPKLQHGEERAHLFLVADGMGGHKAGERASALVVLAIERFALNKFKWFFESGSVGAQQVLASFQSAIREADAQILEESRADPERSGMGTTLTMAFHLGTQVCIVHVGASRAYLFRDAELHQLTDDHTFTADLVRSGEIRPDQAAGHCFRHVITNVLGGPELGVTIQARAFEAQAGDRLLLCSDGLTESVTNEEIAAILDAESEPEAGARRLLARANEGPAMDNITAVIVRFDQAAA